MIASTCPIHGKHTVSKLLGASGTMGIWASQLTEMVRRNPIQLCSLMRLKAHPDIFHAASGDGG